MKYTPGYAPYLLGRADERKPRLVMLRGEWHSFLGGTEEMKEKVLEFLERGNGKKYHATRRLLASRK